MLRHPLLTLILVLGYIPSTFAGAPPPFWVQTNGAMHDNMDSSRFIVGYAVARDGKEGDRLEAAKARAVAQISEAISLRIHSEFTDYSQEANGKSVYEISSIMTLVSDIALSGVKIQTYMDPSGDAYALAALDRKSAATEKRRLRDAALREAKTHLGSKTENEAARLQALLHAQRCLIDAVTNQAIVVVLAHSPEDQALDIDLALQATGVATALEALKQSRATSIDGAIALLAFQLKGQGVQSGKNLTISPLWFGVTSLSSVFGRYVALHLAPALASQKGKAAAPAVLEGTYFVTGDDIKIVCQVRDVDSGRTVAAAQTTLAKKAVGAELPLQPQNYQQALADQKVLGLDEIVSGGLRLELWTSTGGDRQVLHEGVEFSIFVRINQPAYVRLIYHLADGKRVLLEDGYRIDASKVNFSVEYPEKFEIAPPFGVERLHAVASTEKMPPLRTRRETVEGVEYDLVDDLPATVAHRGIKRVKRDSPLFTEALLTVTTLPAN